MAPASFIFRLAALVWVVIFTCDNVAVRSGTFLTASALSPIPVEKEALLNTSWWSSNWTTANYSSDHCKWIGVTCNSAGSIIKLYLLRYYFDFYAQAQLPNGRVFALKKLHTSETEELAFIESFQNEAQVLSQVLHRNIVKFCGFCSHRKCMFLIYEYMERGSLFCILHNDDEAVELDWPKRVDIVKAMAHALAYLHHDCSPSIVHRDISSNNIPLNSKLEALVADFGT